MLHRLLLDTTLVFFFVFVEQRGDEERYSVNFQIGILLVGLRFGKKNIFQNSKKIGSLIKNDITFMN